MNKILISFATSDKWLRSQCTLNESAIKHGFTHYLSFNPSNIDIEFTNRHYNILNNNTRGYGYWIWKAAILKQTFDIANDGDIIAYVDSGNAIINNLDFIFNECKSRDIILFDNRDGNPHGQVHTNRLWTKRDAFVLMNLDDKKYYDAPQVDGSYQLYKKTKHTVKFINEYLEFCENENIITDLPNTTGQNLPEFLDHRHDQSILSLMAAKHQITLYPEPSEWGNHLARPYPQLFWHHRGVF
jgi:hypothetical protein